MAPIQSVPGPNTIPIAGMANITTSSSSTPPQSLISRTQRFIEDNKLVLLGAAVLAASAGGYYYYTSTRDGRGSGGGGKPGSSSSSASEGTGGSKKSKKNKKKKGGNGDGGKFLSGEGSSGPLLEEIPQEVREKQENKEAESSHLADVPDATKLSEMSDAERNALGATLKERGNKLFKNRDFTRAVECYTEAMRVSVRKDAVFFSNRAACYTQFDPPEYEKCVADCDEALKLDHAYVKALKRRATALENLGRDEDAIRDYTAASIIDRFRDNQAVASVERCLDRVARKKAKEIIETREPRLPSPNFTHSYLSAFRPRPKPTLPENPSQGDQTLILAFDALEATDYIHALSFVNEAIEQGISWTEGQAEAFNLRGTFKFVMGDSLGAKADLEQSLDLLPSLVQSRVKLASVHVDLNEDASAFGDFEDAARYNPNDPDIYYHRGQGGQEDATAAYEKAIADYNKSTDLDRTFLFSHVQQAVAQYKLGNLGGAMAAFRKILREFPDRGEPSNYYGELMLDQKKFQESIERFDKSLELDKDRRPRNVLPLVNKALAIFQWKHDFAQGEAFTQAEAACKEALAIDPECDVAVATLAQLSLQQGKIDEAIEWFEQSAKLARTQDELFNAIRFEKMSRTQKDFLRDYPEMAGMLSQMAGQM
ncbi:hypothetical protein BCR39DRAFT_468703 [Naematelia encephala]|uniref:Mitochondrial outer membrane translocase receptor TOM70 n=1 Tax=Naematelia encephala TaxID=71784 RepID=A0A1Y2AZK6_9TREE|nr:hypothetical protein BCR39DRAFT_468703 [Naematelia encephala]